MQMMIYGGACYCVPCGTAIRRRLEGAGAPYHADSDETTYDSNDYPKGPYPDGGGEADSPQHCDSCGLHLENPLTPDGVAYVREAMIDAGERGQVSIVDDWAAYYAADLE